MKVASIVGARPQFIKAAVLSRAFARWNEAHPGSVHEVIVHTGQHYDPNMSDVFFEEMGLRRPDHNLGVGGGPHGAMTGRMLEGIERLLQEAPPEWAIVYGDTNSTLAGALAAAKLRIPVAHVESGLRSFNRRMPEEVNRVLTDHLSQLLLVPTRTAVANLAREGIAGDQVVEVGDVMLDAARHYGKTAVPSPGTKRLIDVLGEDFLVATIHRPENTDDPQRLRSILGALEELSAQRAVVLPLHPRTRKVLAGWSPPPTLHVLEPVGYLDMLCLLRACAGVLTDSGGLQKEAYFFRRPCLVLRDETEWVELVEGGYNQLVGADRGAILKCAETFFDRAPHPAADLFGDGHAGDRIVAELIERAGSIA